MSAIAIIRAPDAVVIATDGVSYGDGGIVSSIGSKVLLAPQCSCAIAHSGVGGSAERVFNRMEPLSPCSFDDVLSLIEAAAREIAEYYATSAFRERQSAGGDSGPYHFSLYIGGWSAARSRAETYMLCTNPDAHKDLQLSALQLAPLPQIYLFPWADSEIARHLGFVTPDEMTEETKCDYALRAVCAARFQRVLFRDPNDRVYGVGGFLQLTTIQHNHVQSSIFHRWSDVIGEKINPLRGAALPAILAATLVPNDEPRQ